MFFSSPMPLAGNLLRDQLVRLRGDALVLVILSLALGMICVGIGAMTLALIDSGLPSRSLASAAGLVAVAAMLSAFILFLGTIRRHSLRRLADLIETRLDALAPAMLTSRVDALFSEGLAISAQRQAVGRLVGSPATLAMLDLAALPLYLAISFALGWPFGLVVLVTVVAATLALGQAWRTTAAQHRDAAAHRHSHGHLSSTAARDAMPLAGQGMAEGIANTLRAGDLLAARAERAAVARRQMLASRIAGIAIAGGVMLVLIAAMRIIETRATIGTLSFVAALFVLVVRPFLVLAHSAHIIVEGRNAWSSLGERLAAWTPAALTIPLPAPKERLSLEQVALYLPGTRRPLLQQINAEAAAGDIVAVVGPSGVGKSVLLHTLAVREATPVGTIRLDGCEIGQWPVGDLNRHIGYLPQEIDLFEGTVGENIARFDPLAGPQAVLAAARAAGIHERIVRLEQGYDTPVGPGGRNLPLALRQRVGLARALFGDPLVVLLDDPTAHLDAREAAELIESVQAAAARGAIVLIATSSPRLIDVAHHVMMLRSGRMVDFGPREEVRERVTARRKLSATPRDTRVPAPAPAPADH